MAKRGRMRWENSCFRLEVQVAVRVQPPDRAISGSPHQTPISFSNLSDVGAGSVTEQRSGLQDLLEHAIEVGWRRGNHPQHLTQSRLLLQRLSQPGVAL